MRRPFTGRHMLATMIGFFGVIMAVNFTMARFAYSTFGGVVVENSYVASQEFNGWLELAEAQEALGWQVQSEWRDDRRVAVAAANAPDLLEVSAVARHPLGSLPDIDLVFERMADGQYLSTTDLPEGRWTLRLHLQSGPHQWRREDSVQ